MYNRKKCKKQTTQIFPLRKSDHFPPKPSTNRISQTSKTKTHFQKTDPFCQNRCRTAVPTRKIQTFHQKTGDPNRGDPLRKIESHTALLREGSQRERERYLDDGENSTALCFSSSSFYAPLFFRSPHSLSTAPKEMLLPGFPSIGFGFFSK